MWTRLVRWLAREHLAYLEYENKELRYEGERYRHMYEGAINSMRVFEQRYRYMENAIADATMLQPPAPIIVKREK